MKLYLSSERIGNKTELLIKWQKENNNKILVIPNALDAYEENEAKRIRLQEKIDELESIGFEAKILDLKNYFPGKENLEEGIGEYKAFYVLGGNVFVLRRAMKLSGFDEYLRDKVKEPNYLYAGYSAGICVLAKDLHGIDIADEPEKDPYDYGEIIWEGVGLIDYMLVPHYDTPGHHETEAMYKVVEYLKENDLPYKTLKGKDVVFIDDDLN